MDLFIELASRDRTLTKDLSKAWSSSSLSVSMKLVGLSALMELMTDSFGAEGVVEVVRPAASGLLATGAQWTQTV